MPIVAQLVRSGYKLTSAWLQPPCMVLPNPLPNRLPRKLRHLLEASSQKGSTLPTHPRQSSWKVRVYPKIKSFSLTAESPVSSNGRRKLLIPKRSSRRGAVEMNPTRKLEVAGLILGLAQWVKDPVLL